MLAACNGCQEMGMAPLLPGFYTGAENQAQCDQLLKPIIKKNIYIDRLWSFHLPVVVVCMSALIN